MDAGLVAAAVSSVLGSARSEIDEQVQAMDPRRRRSNLRWKQAAARSAPGTMPAECRARVNCCSSPPKLAARLCFS